MDFAACSFSGDFNELQLRVEWKFSTEFKWATVDTLDDTLFGLKVKAKAKAVAKSKLRVEEERQKAVMEVQRIKAQRVVDKKKKLKVCRREKDWMNFSFDSKCIDDGATIHADQFQSIGWCSVVVVLFESRRMMTVCGCVWTTGLCGEAPYRQDAVHETG